MTIKAALHEHFRTSSRTYGNEIDKISRIGNERLGDGGMISIVNYEDSRYEDILGQIKKDQDCKILENAVVIDDITMIKGQEVPTDKGHLLVLGIPRHSQIRSGMGLEYTIDLAKGEYNAIVIADHPFYFEGIGQELINNKRILEKLDGIEVFNGTATFGLPIGPFKMGANDKAKNFYEAIKKDFDVGGLFVQDGHSYYEAARSYSQIENIDTSDSQTLNDSLRSSIQKHKDQRHDRKNAILGSIGAMDHISDLLMLLGPKMIYNRMKSFIER